MVKGIWLSEDKLDEIVSLLNNIDVEIGSTITYPNDSEKVMANMRRANYNLFEVKNASWRI